MNKGGKIKKKKKINIDINKVYTPLSVAKKELKKRWNNPELMKKVEEFLGEIPDVFKKEPRTILFRFIATPNFEFKIVSEMSKMVNLKPVFMELLNDKFCTRNQDKVYLGKMRFFDEKYGKSHSITSCKKIIDLEKNEGKKFKNMKTLWGDSFIDFHNKLFSFYYKDAEKIDCSIFYKKNGESNYEVYLKIFAICICKGILFENYFVDVNKDEKKFAKEVILPAFEKVKKMFGVKPLIVPLLSNNGQGNLLWQYYPDSIRKKDNFLEK
jgi:hypothetical protein